MKIIGLTGGIASGKSTVAKELRKQNVPVFDADEVSRNAVAKGSKGLALVVSMVSGTRVNSPSAKVNVHC